MQTVVVRNGYDAGEAIKTRRLELGLSQEELATKAALGVRTVIRLEQATTAMPVDALVTTLHSIGTVLGITFVIEPGRPGGVSNA